MPHLPIPPSSASWWSTTAIRRRPAPCSPGARRASHGCCVIEGQGNIGFAAGCNLAARHIDSDFLLLLNPDCVLPPGGAGLLREELRRRPGPALLGAVMVDSAGQVQRATRRNLPSLANLLGEALPPLSPHPGLAADRDRRAAAHRDHRRSRHQRGGHVPDAGELLGAGRARQRLFPACRGSRPLRPLSAKPAARSAWCRRCGCSMGAAPAMPALSSSKRHKTRGFRRYFRKQGARLGRTPAAGGGAARPLRLARYIGLAFAWLSRAAARIWLRLWRIVSASGSILISMSVGFPAAMARSKIGPNSSVFTTSSPWAP